MIDFHNHVLPGVDDGAKDIEMAINMLKTASSQGITDVINTIHFQNLIGLIIQFQCMRLLKDQMSSWHIHILIFLD